MKSFYLSLLGVLALTLAVKPVAAAEITGLKRANSASDRYIVTLKESPAAKSGIPFDIATKAQAMSKKYGGKTLHTYRYAQTGFAVEISYEKAKRLAQDPAVARIEADSIVSLSDITPWGLDRLDQGNLPLDGMFGYPSHQGANVHVYVLDTGVLTTHSEFNGRIGTGISKVTKIVTSGSSCKNTGGILICEPPPTKRQTASTALLASAPYCTSTNFSSFEDCNGHGTHVAGTIGGTTWGVAKGVTIHPVRVIGWNGFGYTADIISGIDWVVQQHQSNQLPSVANLSFGSGTDTALNTAVQGLITSGVITVVSAGNDGADACNKSPAAVSAAIVVGASTQTDAKASFSNFGTCVDLYAPGAEVRSAGIATTTASAKMSGTSMSAPHVTGAAALYLASYPNASQNQIENALVVNALHGKITGIPFGANELLNTQFLGRTVIQAGIPKAPSSIVATMRKCYGSNLVSWASVEGATHYELWASSTSTFTSKWKVVTTTSTQHIEDFSRNTYLKASACNQFGCSNLSVSTISRYWSACEE